MEIKVGEYVRLARCQGINKIIDIDEDGFLILDDNIADEYGDECCQISLQDADKEILKHSFNIIDLIKPFDILEYKLKNFKFISRGIVYKDYDGRKGEYYNIVNGYRLEEVQIIRILTHEQYERNCYSLEDN